VALDKIVIKGARVHNLKNIDIELPRDKFIVMTGLSGSGKSSLAFDTIYAEGQRRYVESLSSYARMFLGQMDKPDVDYIEGLSPAISIDQKTTSKNPRSTVGTVTEIYDYLRLLFARVGVPYCPSCGKMIQKQTVEQIVDQVMEFSEGTRIQILAPVVSGQKGTHKKLFEEIKKKGFVRIKVNGEVYDVAEPPDLDKNKKHDIAVIVDRIVIKEGIENRLADSLETVFSLSDGILKVDNLSENKEYVFSKNFGCPDCGINFPEINPRMFSFNNPYGACSVCGGLGTKMEISPELVVPDPKKTIRQGAIAPWNTKFNGIYMQTIMTIAEKYGFSVDIPFEDLSDKEKKIILYGSGKEIIQFEYVNGEGDVRKYKSVFEGVIPNLERRHLETNSDFMRTEIEKYMENHPCSGCHGARLKEEALAIKIGEKNIYEVTIMTIEEAFRFFVNLQFSDRDLLIANQIINEIKARLSFLLNVGLDYLTLARNSGTLSGGEAQRIRLATQIGSGLVGVLYILDEPSIGLHQRDNEKLIRALKELRDLGNTLIVVEHDEDTIREADYVVDIGPYAGAHGGEIIAAGTPEEIIHSENSITGQYLSGRKKIEIPEKRKKPGSNYIEIVGAEENNLQKINAKIPIGLFTCITGVSGSGKSTLVNEILYKGAARAVYPQAKMKPGKFKELKGMENIDKVIEIDQSPIGRTPRSNPATYISVFDDIRQVFAMLPESKMRAYKPGRFSFNVAGGRCEACSGDGILKIEMHFLPDVYIPCEVCKGSRYNRETLEVKYKGKNIAEVLDMTVEEAVVFFENIPKIYRKLKTLEDVGLGYVKLGQSATTLSGGEAQRVKLASELHRKSGGKTLYILDEPTTGLHTADIHKFLEVIEKIKANNDTIVIIEHNLDVIKSADYIIDLGPEGGNKGGRIIAQGTPEEIAENQLSHTGEFLKKILR
jgi:excinuclease ABC subunit A